YLGVILLRIHVISVSVGHLGKKKELDGVQLRAEYAHLIVDMGT
ncbi:hypothetical protein Tco_0947207, partial [Tanacetum coccineum]